MSCRAKPAQFPKALCDDSDKAWRDGREYKGVKPYNPYQPSKQQDGSRGPSAPLPQAVTRSLECGAVARHRNPSIPSGASLQGAVFGCRRNLSGNTQIVRGRMFRGSQHKGKPQPFKCSQQIMFATRKLPLQPFLVRKRKKPFRRGLLDWSANSPRRDPPGRSPLSLRRGSGPLANAT